MSDIWQLTKRNIKVFFKSKSNIFFSTLSILILLFLHFAVFRNMFADNWEQVFAAGNIPLEIERSKITWLVDSMIFAAIIPMAAVTISLTALAQMTTDKQKNSINDFLVSPIKRQDMLVGYLLSSFIIGGSLCFAFLVIFEIFFLIVYGVGFAVVQMLAILAVTLFSLVFANVFMLLIITFIKTEQTLGAIGTILGTMIGFMCGAYIPVGMFGEMVGNIFSLLPFLQLTVLSRQAFIMNISEVLPFNMEMLTGPTAQGFGLECWIFGNLIPLWGVALITLGFTVAMFTALVIIFKKLKKKD